MSIRLQLLIVALSTLVLPWAGWQYARELEAALRGSQEQSLLASAGTIANALSAQPRRVFRNSDLRAFDARSGDLYVHPLTSQPLLDGYHEDWDTPFDATVLPTVSGYHARLQAGANEVGPSLHGIFTRKAGELADFRYSPAIKRSGIVWTPEALEKFISDPQAMVPGNRMPYAGMASPDDRANLIAYLQNATK